MGVDKKILEQYVDACEMIRETEQDIKRSGRCDKRRDDQLLLYIWRQR